MGYQRASKSGALFSYIYLSAFSISILFRIICHICIPWKVDVKWGVKSLLSIDVRNFVRTNASPMTSCRRSSAD